MATGPNLHITFYDYLAPRLTAGTYRIHAEHTLLEGTTDITGGDGLPDADAEFEVRAAQFMLDESAVHTVYPPRGSSGRYDTVLPHITLTRSVLPWERKIPWSKATARAPWMALLVFAEGELPDDPEALGIATSRTVAQLCTTGEPAVRPPAIDPNDLDPKTLTSGCRTIDVPTELFTALIPTEDELYYLAHVRDVYQPRPRADGEVLTEGSFAVVTGNRFLREPGPRTAHLVSLEGHDEPLKGEYGSTTTHIRLASLWSWNFTHDPAGLDPARLLQQLVAPGLEDPTDPANAERLALRLEPAIAPDHDPDADEQYALDRLAAGYVPLPQRLLSGELGYAWYRGPCTPVTTQPLPDGYDADPKTQTTADHALVYDKDYGVYDVGYACAWTLGRTLALADPDYSADLTRARRELSNHAVALMALAADPARARTNTPRTGDTAADPDTDLRPNLGWLRTLATASRDLPRAMAAPQPHADLPEEPAPAPLGRADRRLLLGTRSRQAALRSTAEDRTAGMPAWLDRLDHLYGIPFNHLVPDPRMLPPESLRLFRVDPQWLDALRNGARSVGLHTSLDQQLDSTLHAALAARSTAAAPTAGLLLRSALVPAWPEFDLVARRGERVLTELRRAHPAPDVLLLLFDDVPETVVIREPGEGIHFGTDPNGRIALRRLDPDDGDLGAPLERAWPDAGSIHDSFLREGPHGVLNLLGPGGLVPALSGEFEHTERLSPSEFAIEMINAPLEQKLVPAPGGSRVE
ncbi:hypothetical protein [Embleya sp. NBC_00896]|uniref:hypothetical protein n=1 Tax=Embleya sp. NBC_00896 TaxID=2975961 RepID=UPI002F914853|nr:hypothetical protein OG928_46910 [Embleya sp. NBC_00896]